MKKRLRTRRTVEKLRLSRAQWKLIARVTHAAKSKARQKLADIRTAARKLKSTYVKENRPTMGRGLKRRLAKTTVLNTWNRERQRGRVRMSFRRIRAGKNAGMFREKRTGKLVSESTLNRKVGALKYWDSVRFLREQLGGTTREARRAYKAFIRLELMSAVEISSD